MGAEDFSSFDFFGSDNPPSAVYDPFPDTSLGAEAFGPASPSQEDLGRQIVLNSQRGYAQEQLGRDIVEGSLIDRFLANPDNTQPWYKGIDGGLGATGKLLASVPGLFSTGKTPTQGGIPIQLGTQPSFGNPAQSSGIFSIFPSNTTRDGRTGTLQGASARRTATGTLEFGGTDYLYLALGLVGAFAAYKLVKAF